MSSVIFGVETAEGLKNLHQQRMGQVKMHFFELKIRKEYLFWPQITYVFEFMSEGHLLANS